ncbi:MAG: VCBS repeat-containing protein [Planctomycetes bacterium]|nr:VCBS repeat-containing protein [Planctomycetota bacterium]
MDLNADGHLDILSGSYSRMDKFMAGLFQVLWGNPDGTFQSATQLVGSDGEPLIIPATEEDMVDRICTRPTAVDINGDGELDIVSGNFGGTFYVFFGDGNNRFNPSGEWLQSAGKKLHVPHHSDPFFTDWDGDGDQDMLSGSAQGGVYLFINNGTKRFPHFGPSQLIAKPSKTHGAQFGSEDLAGPQSSTRVWADDMNGDGKLDLLVGDNATLNFPAEGLTTAEAQERYNGWIARQTELSKGFADASAADNQDEINARWEAHYNELENYVRQERTGFVWVYYQK